MGAYYRNFTVVMIITDRELIQSFISIAIQESLFFIKIWGGTQLLQLENEAIKNKLKQ